MFSAWVAQFLRQKSSGLWRNSTFIGDYTSSKVYSRDSQVIELILMSVDSVFSKITKVYNVNFFRGKLIHGGIRGVRDDRIDLFAWQKC